VNATRDTLERVAATLAALDQHYPAPSRRSSLLTTSNPKVDRGAAERGYLSAVLHLAPHTMAGVNVCAWATTGPDGCVAGCLNTAGRGGIALDASGWNRIQAARIRRTAAYVLDPERFIADLRVDILNHARAAHDHNLRPALRLNGTSDIPWHRHHPDMVNWCHGLGVVLYDYTKRPKPDAADHGIDVTYSYPGGDGRAARRYLEGGHRVAVVFDTRKGDELPRKWYAPWGDAYPVVDGDAHDLRFLDAGGVVVGLRAKGRLVGQVGTPRGFVQPSTI
jgi:hypothetical protein